MCVFCVRKVCRTFVQSSMHCGKESSLASEKERERERERERQHIEYISSIQHIYNMHIHIHACIYIYLCAVVDTLLEGLQRDILAEFLNSNFLVVELQAAQRSIQQQRSRRPARQVAP
jgi:hypothetical protein